MSALCHLHTHIHTCKHTHTLYIIMKRTKCGLKRQLINSHHLRSGSMNKHMYVHLMRTYTHTSTYIHLYICAYVHSIFYQPYVCMYGCLVRNSKSQRIEARQGHRIHLSVSRGDRRQQKNRMENRKCTYKIVSETCCVFFIAYFNELALRRTYM